MFPVRIKQTLFAAAVLALAGCSSQGTTAMPSNNFASHAVQPAPVQSLDLTETTITQHVGVRLNGENPKISAKYGRVLGYFNGKTSPDSEIVQLTASTTVVFNNVDGFAPHTASFLGKATRRTAPWPAQFNGSGTQSPAGTVISTTGFSTGTLNPGTKSLKYNSGAPGFYMIGCAFHYNLDGMRTVIIVS
jgi:plastocyanin